MSVIDFFVNVPQPNDEIFSESFRIPISIFPNNENIRIFLAGSVFDNYRVSLINKIHEYLWQTKKCYNRVEIYDPSQRESTLNFNQRTQWNSFYQDICNIIVFKIDYEDGMDFPRIIFEVGEFFESLKYDEKRMILFMGHESSMKNYIQTRINNSHEDIKKKISIAIDETDIVRLIFN